eukprot:12267-Heterococcus_DN1.PRE.4
MNQYCGVTTNGESHLAKAQAGQNQPYRQLPQPVAQQPVNKSADHSVSAWFGSLTAPRFLTLQFSVLLKTMVKWPVSWYTAAHSQ